MNVKILKGYLMSSCYPESKDKGVGVRVRTLLTYSFIETEAKIVGQWARPDLLLLYEKQEDGEALALLYIWRCNERCKGHSTFYLSRYLLLI